MTKTLHEQIEVMQHFANFNKIKLLGSIEVTL